LITGRLIALNDRKGKKGRWRGGRARQESRGGAGSGGAAGGRRKEGGEGRLTGGAQASAAQGKRKGEGEGGPAREAGWAAWAEKEPVQISFFFFSLSTSFSNHFSSQIQFKLVQTFLKNFINFLETSQATKNHASQLMMHIHLLSLNLLNYI
jgi:hypothetical protein